MTHTKPTIDAFAIGAIYSTGFVGAFFNKSNPTIREWVRRGMLHGRKVVGSRDYAIDGESVRVLYGRMMLAQDAAKRGPAKLPRRDMKKARAALVRATAV